MHHVDIQIGKLQIPQALRTGHQHVTFPVPVIPYLGHNGKVFPLHNAVCKGFLKHLADLLFISISRRTVKQPVTCFYGAVNSV